ncbi:MAG: T9SS type A sorting domain-containing protein [Paludibacter sp.]|nr:T9SS type A sorting domain-containing protein [Paludibacter sp.]
MKHKKLQNLKGQFLVLICLLYAIGIQAQTWTAPTLTGSTLTTGTTYYVYNVGSNGYLNRGGYWRTAAVVTASPSANAAPATIIKWTATNTSGIIWTFQYNSAGANVSNNFLFGGSTTDGSLFTDNSTNNTWNVVQTDAVNNIYSIQALSTYGGYAAASQYLGSAATPEVANLTTQTGNTGTFNAVRSNRNASSYTQWKFVTQADLDLYNARVLLDRYMKYAKAGGTIDLTSYISDYNAGVTATVNSDAATLLTALSRIDVTSSITNPSFETTPLSSWTNSGSFASQSNVPGQGWTKAGTYYAEKYTSSAYGTNGNGVKGYLGVGTITQTLAIPNGLYGMIVSAHAIQQAGANPLKTGAFITAGSKSTEVAAGQDYYIDSISVNNGSLAIGYALQGTVQVNWTGFDNFRLYRYVTYSTPSLAASVSALRYDNIYNTSSFTVVGANLSSDITITVPSGITLSGANITGGSGSYSISAGNVNATSTITVTYDGSTVVNGSISLNASGSQAVSSSVTVVGSSNASCYTPVYSQGNMIADPTFSAVDLTTGGYVGWGSKGVDINFPYCGRGSGYVVGGNTGSLDRTLSAANGNALIPNTQYRLRTLYRTKIANSNKYQIQIDGYSAATSLFYFLTQNTNWTQFDQIFTTGSTVTTGRGVYINSYNTGSVPSSSDTLFIDNYELYPVPKTYSSSSSLTFLGAGITQKVAVRASNLTQDITISVPASFSIDKTSMLKTVSGSTSDSLAITFNGPNSASGYVHFISGSINDSILVTGTVAPTIVLSSSNLAFDDLNSTSTFNATCGNLVSDLTMTAPSGITLSGTNVTGTWPTYTIVVANANATHVINVTYDALAALSGNITLSSAGATSQTVSVSGIRNADCFTPLHAIGNLISDPYLNSLTDYTFSWGVGTGAVINTDVSKVYCGLKSGKVTGQRAGGILYPLSGKWAINSGYRVRAKILVESGTFQVNVAGGPNVTAPTFTTSASWQTTDFKFATGATLNATASNQFLYFDNYASNAAGTGYIDNLEMYNIPLISATAGTGGTVSGAGPFDIGESVSLIATPTTGYHFVNWTEGATEVSTSATYTFSASANRTLVANFASNTVSVTSDTNASTLVNCAACNVTVATGATLTIDATKTLNSITIASGGKVSNSVGSTLTVATLTINSDATGTGTFVDNGSSAITTANVNQYITSGRNWYVSSPVAAASVSTINTATGSSIVGYDEVNGTSAPWVTETTTLTPVKGYIVVSPINTNPTITFSGTLNTGNLSVGLTRTAGQTKEGFNLVGNPYPSFVNGRTAINSNPNLDKTIWYRTKNIGNTAYFFDTYNTTSEIGTNNNGYRDVTGTIPPMQAVWVRVSAGQTSTTLNFDNSLRSHKNDTINPLKVRSTVNANQQILRLQVSNGTNSDEAVIYFNSNASDGYDVYDSPKMTNVNAAIPEIYTVAGVEKLAINGLNCVTPNEEVPLGFTTGQSNMFTIKATQFSNFDAATKVYLRDNLLNTEQELNDVTAYDFTSDVASTNTRFRLIFKSIGLTTGLNNADIDQVALIYKNVNNQISITCKGDISSDAIVSVYNVVGQKLQTKQIMSTSTVIGSGFASGVYVVTVNNGGKSITQKVALN